MFRSSDHAFYASSQVSDDASTTVEIRRSNSDEKVSTVIRAKLASHPLYFKSAEAFINCQKDEGPFIRRNLSRK
ncbi:Homeobox protein knotted-1-like [Sarracenia purpurea var. burkii]